VSFSVLVSRHVYVFLHPAQNKPKQKILRSNQLLKQKLLLPFSFTIVFHFPIVSDDFYNDKVCRVHSIQVQHQNEETDLTEEETEIYNSCLNYANKFHREGVGKLKQI